MSEAAQAQPAPPAKKGSKLYIIIGVVIVLLAGGGGGAFWFMRSRAPKDAAAEQKEKEAKEKTAERGLISFEPFVVNLADPNVSRFLRVTVQLVVPGKEVAEKIQKTPVDLLRVRSAILDVLTAQTSDKLVTPDGKTELKHAISEKAGEALDETKVLDVLFTDFVIQF